MSDAPFFPTHEVVIEAWIAARVTGMTPAMVASSLPAPAAWATSATSSGGFVTVDGIAGTPAADLPVSAPVATISTWANRVDSSKPPWGYAGNLAMSIQRAAFESPLSTRLDLGARFRDVLVLNAEVVREPGKISGDPRGFARFSLDLLLRYAVAPE